MRLKANSVISPQETAWKELAYSMVRSLLSSSSPQLASNKTDSNKIDSNKIDQLTVDFSSQ